MSEQEVFPLTVTVEQPLLPREQWSLPEFRDQPCVKCGNEAAATAYHCGVASYKPCYQHWQANHGDGDGRSTWNFPEHFDRRCDRCGYEWCEAIL